MFDYDIQRCTRRCAATQQELTPGDTVYSVLSSKDGLLERTDYSAAGWREPPEGCLAWWKWKLPPPGGRKPSWAPHQTILEFFQRLDEQPDQLDLRYVLALLMVRRRIVRMERTEKDAAGQESLVLFSPHGDCEHRVLVVEPAAGRLKDIQHELEKLLISDSPAAQLPAAQSPAPPVAAPSPALPGGERVL